MFRSEKKELPESNHPPASRLCFLFPECQFSGGISPLNIRLFPPEYQISGILINACVYTRQDEKKSATGQSRVVLMCHSVRPRLLGYRLPIERSRDVQIRNKKEHPESNHPPASRLCFLFPECQFSGGI